MFESHPQSEIPINKNENQGCQASMGNGGKCGEVKTLDILKEFQQLYENKLSEIKDDCSCTSTRIKIQMLEDWVKDLTEQNTMLVQVVEELEQEASERVSLLEEKLRHSSKTSFEIMKTLQEYDAQNISSQSDILQRLMFFQSDVNNLTEFIRRIREDGNWSTEGLHFYSVAKDDLSEIMPSSARNLSKQTDLETSLEKLKLELSKSKLRHDEHEKETKRREMLIREQTDQIEKLNVVVERCATSMPDKQKLLEELHELRAQLKLKTEDFNRLDLSVKDMREALTAEVADKHDSVVALRRECQLLEERCRQADKQTHFKDDIIKEMRKELKQFRSKFDLDGENKEDMELRNQLFKLQEENENLHKTISSANAELNILHGLIQKYYIYEEYEDKMLVASKQLKLFNNKSYMASEEIISSSVTSLIKSDVSFNVTERLNSIEKYCGELLALTRENKEQHESMISLKNQINMHLSSENIFITHETDSINSITNEREQDLENDFTKTVILLKTDISKMILRKSDSEINNLKKHVSSIEHTFHEIQSKDQLIKNKDEMINIQNDTLNVAQKELKELRDKLADIEKERDTRMQEVQNLQQALKINQSTIEELEKALRNSEEKANNIQQTADLYVETISLLENAKNKAENEVEQQRITIGNLQDALVNTKKQLEGVQGHSAAELKEKCGAIYTLYQELDEMQTQYMDCYGENVKLSQTADCLRDANLELKVININFQQDIEELNTKIMNDKIIIASLEDNVKKIMSTNDLLEGDIYLMKTEMGNLSSELKVLQELLKLSVSSPVLEESNLSLTKSLNILQEHSEALVDQLKLAQKQVSREIKLNDLNTDKITELKKLLDKKAEELQETKFKLDHSVREAKEHENKLKEKELQILQFQNQQDLLDQKTDAMVITCNSDLICLKQKIDVLNKILNEKSNEILRLHAELSIKADTITSLLKENELVIKDNKKLTHNAMNLEDQLQTYKSRCADINEKYNKSKTEIEHFKHWEDSFQEEYRREKKVLTEKLEASKREETKLNSMLKDSKDELEIIKISLKQKDEEVKNLTSTQEEVIALKEEINMLTKMRSRVLDENQKLQDQISKLNIGATQFENRNLIISQQLDKCLDELNTLQCSKDKIEERNIQLETELEHLQRAFTEVNHEIRYKTESFNTLEQELSETKCSRDEICAESRMVVSNVRSWLEEQKRINVTLNNTLKDKNLVIEELTMEKNLLMKNIKDVCERYETLSEELHLCRQYLSEMNDDHQKMIKPATPMKRSVYTWGSQGSVEESPVSSPVLMDELNYDYLDENDGEPNPARWMRKVQNMSEDLLKSKKYWQTKMAKSTKKMKPVKDKSLKST